MRLLSFLLLFTVSVHAQSPLRFDKGFIHSEDRWVAFLEDTAGQHPFGFIYIDAEAGLTLDYKGHFRVDPSGRFVVTQRFDTNSVKIRLEPNGVKVAFIPEEKLSELNVPLIPDWLSIYKGDTNSVQRLYRWGFLYNAWNECAKALTYLHRARDINPDYPGLAFELAFSYNALEQYNKALPIIEAALVKTPKDCLLYKELAFTQQHTGELEKAGATYAAALSNCDDPAVRAEIAYNMAYQYYKRKDKAGLTRWAAEIRKWAKAGDQFLTNLKRMEASL